MNAPIQPADVGAGTTAANQMNAGKQHRREAPGREQAAGGQRRQDIDQDEHRVGSPSRRATGQAATSTNSAPSAVQGVDRQLRRVSCRARLGDVVDSARSPATTGRCTAGPRPRALRPSQRIAGQLPDVGGIEQHADAGRRGRGERRRSSARTRRRRDGIALRRRPARRRRATPAATARAPGARAESTRKQPFGRVSPTSRPQAAALHELAPAEVIERADRARAETATRCRARRRTARTG